MVMLAVAAGGLIGALLRFWTGEWLQSFSWNTGAGSYPLGTLIINLTGCFILGWLLSSAAVRRRLPEPVRLGIGTGMIGSFTTFSTFSVETLALVNGGAWLSAASYVLASLTGGWALAVCGAHIARMQDRMRETRAAKERRA